MTICGPNKKLHQNKDAVLCCYNWFKKTPMVHAAVRSKAAVLMLPIFVVILAQ